jgi:hypothetical protein
MLLVRLDDFTARSSDELSLARGDRVELVERDDDFGDGWYLGRHLTSNATGLFPEGELSKTPTAVCPSVAVLTSHSLYQSRAPNPPDTRTTRTDDPHAAACRAAARSCRPRRPTAAFVRGIDAFARDAQFGSGG